MPTPTQIHPPPVPPSLDVRVDFPMRGFKGELILNARTMPIGNNRVVLQWVPQRERYPYMLCITLGMQSGIVFRRNRLGTEHRYFTYSQHPSGFRLRELAREPSHVDHP